MMKRMLSRMGVRPDDIPDLTQTALLQAWKAQTHGHAVEYPQTYAGQAARSAFLNAKRSRSRNRSGAFLNAGSDHDDISGMPIFDRNSISIDRVLIHRQFAQEVERAVAQMSPELQRTFDLYFRQEMTIKKTAEELGVAPGTVKSRVLRMRQALAHLNPYEQSAPAP